MPEESASGEIKGFSSERVGKTTESDFSRGSWKSLSDDEFVRSATGDA